ncbi:MAG: 4Fe-4S dicluster domain-containing protein [Kiritimatiellia bacterium]
MTENGIRNPNPAKSRPLIDAEECKGCERCIAACPVNCLRIARKLNSKGVRPVEYTGSGCIGCEACFYNCPEPYAIKIEKADDRSESA